MLVGFLTGPPFAEGESIGAPSVFDVSLFLATVLLGFALVLSAGGVALLIRGSAIDLLRTRVLLGSLVGIPVVGVAALGRWPGRAPKRPRLQPRESRQSGDKIRILHRTFAFSFSLA